MNKLIQILFFCAIPILSFAEEWNKKANFGGVGRHRALGISIGNKGYIGLGHVNGTGLDISYNDWWQFDPSSNSWTQKANYPTVNHGAVGFGTSTKGYVGGGSYLNGEFYCYDPQLNTWTAIATCPVSPGDVQCFSIQNRGYILSGTLLYEYVPFTNSWTAKASCPITVNTWSASFATSTSGFVKTNTSLYEYKPSLDTWIQRANFQGLMSGGGAAFECNDKGYFVCGYSGSLSIVTNEVWEFNPGNNVWTKIGEFPGTSRRFPVAFSINDIGYFGTGTNGINLNDFWSYDPSLFGVGLNEQETGIVKINSFPNPFTDEITLAIDPTLNMNIEDWSYELFSLTGYSILKGQITGSITKLNTTDLPAGSYIYSVSVAGKKLMDGQLIKR
jgi:N-acetylneuraminic acid mutarotase